MSKTIRIVIHGLPPRELSPNVKYAPPGKRRIKNDWQFTLAWEIQGVRLKAGFLMCPHWEHTELTIEHIIKDRRSILDPDNAIAMHKATIDVLKPMHPKNNPWGMGIIQDDDKEHLKLNPVVFTVDKGRAPMTVITIKEG